MTVGRGPPQLQGRATGRRMARGAFPERPLPQASSCCADLWAGGRVGMGAGAHGVWGRRALGLLAPQN